MLSACKEEEKDVWKRKEKTRERLNGVYILLCLKIIVTLVKECKIFISRELGHHCPELQLVNKVRAQSLKELAAIPSAELSRVQVVFVMEETEHGLCSLKNTILDFLFIRSGD